VAQGAVEVHRRSSDLLPLRRADDRRRSHHAAQGRPRAVLGSIELAANV
jgi:hypothetical protein